MFNFGLGGRCSQMYVLKLMIYCSYVYVKSTVARNEINKKNNKNKCLEDIVYVSAQNYFPKCFPSQVYMFPRTINFEKKSFYLNNF